MGQWLAANWWWVWALVGGSGFVAYRVHRRGGEESMPVRVLYALFPVLDPNSEERRQLTPRAVILVGLGLIIIAIASLLVPGFSG